MAEVSVEEIVQRPPEMVFDFVATHHFENHARWDPDLLEMKQTSSGAVQVGGSKVLLRKRNPQVAPDLFAVEDYAKQHAQYVSNSWTHTSLLPSPTTTATSSNRRHLLRGLP